MVVGMKECAGRPGARLGVLVFILALLGLVPNALTGFMGSLPIRAIFGDLEIL